MRCLVAGRRLADAAAGVEVEFIDADGTRRQEPLSSCWNVAFERVAPVRGFASFRGQRNRPGLWWFATTGEHVGHESWLERDRLMALDADPEVVGVAAQPMWLQWTGESGRLARHAHPRFAQPELAARLGEVFADEAPLLGGASAAGDPVAVLPVLFGMLWRGELAADLERGLLGPAMLVHARGGCAGSRQDPAVRPAG